MTSPAVSPPLTFEAALQELERLVGALENGELPLEASLQTYERGMELLRHCQQTLSQAEQKLRVLDGAVLREFSPPGAAAASEGDAD